MWIVRLALRRPYTFVVFALLLLILGAYSILNMPTDIFPDIDIPVASVVYTYTGLSPQQMADRLVTPIERGLTTTVNDIDRMESNSYNGIAIIKVYFHPSVNISQAVAQITALCQANLRQQPAGTQPPLIIQYRASTVPILQMALSGQGINEQQLNDYGQNTIRTAMATIEGASIPFPYGGKQRQIQVDLNLPALQARGLSPNDVATAVGNQSIVLPSGTIKLGTFEYQVETNSSPTVVEELNNLPVRNVNGSVVYVRDVAHVRDGFPPQTNIVRVDGLRASLLTILKTGSASTLDIISEIKKELPMIHAQVPPSLEIKLINDQSIFVSAAIAGVVREALIAACLTAIMILVFLGSWRSTVIIAVSIPLSILCSIILLSVLGQTINIMTLGGLALAVGILVDDATVEIENINRNLEAGKEIEQAILDGAAQIAVPAFVATLSICIVFVPMFFLSGVARYLFVPMAEAVVFAMLASYLLSRTIVPTMAKYLLKEHDEAQAAKKKSSRNPLVRFQLGFERGFEALRHGYLRVLTLCVDHAVVFVLGFLLFTILSVSGLVPFLGQDFFPSTDEGLLRLHIRAQTGTRIEETAALCDRIDAEIRDVVGNDEVDSIIDNLGLPYSGLNLSYSSSGLIGSADADINVQLKPGHGPSEAYIDKLRERIAKKFPGVIFYELPADMVTQILNFGLAAPIDVQVIGANTEANREVAAKLLDRMRYIPGVADARIQQPFNGPRLNVNVDRTKAAASGMTENDVAHSVLTALSGTTQVSPNYYLSPKNGVSYFIAVQSPQFNLDTRAALESMPVSGSGVLSTLTPGGPLPVKPVQVLGGVASIKLDNEPALVTHYDIQPVIDIYANVHGTDLGSVSRRIQKMVDETRKQLPRGSKIVMRGQTETMISSYVGLLGGLVFSIVLVYLLIVVNFQSWLDPMIIISALPAAIAGIVWFLFLTHTRLSVPALTGAIMCMGVATANSILVVTFAREQLAAQDGDARKAALNAGFVRLRPVMMTALAMIIGMIPMALGMGDGGEQNAPLGRAVIGGLLMATIATLFFVPTFFSTIHGRIERRKRAKLAAEGLTTASELN